MAVFPVPFVVSKFLSVCLLSRPFFYPLYTLCAPKYNESSRHKLTNLTVLESLVPRFRGGVRCPLGPRPVGNQALSRSQFIDSVKMIPEGSSGWIRTTRFRSSTAMVTLPVLGT